MDLTQFYVLLGTTGGLFVASAAVMITLFLWCRSESRADNRQMLSMMQGIQAQIGAIQQEMKDFHGRLERQDAEFKAHLMHYHKE